MPVKYQVTMFTVIGTAIAFTAFHIPLRTRYAEVTRMAIDLDKQNDILIEQLKYLINVLNEHDIELDEFDLIALNFAGSE